MNDLIPNDLIQIVRGRPDEDELAALVAVLLTLTTAAARPAPAGVNAPARAGWARGPARPGSWAGAAAPTWRPVLDGTGG